MNAAETIAAAIEKLEALRDAGTPGPYGFEDGWQPPQWKDSGWTYVRVVAGEPNRISGIRGMVLSTDGTLPASEGKARTLADAELIVTLHRTIDAQLAILRYTAESIRVYRDSDKSAAETYALELDLARSILGVSS